MSDRLHATLVYFGVRRDPDLARRFDTDPMNGWRIAAVSVAIALFVAIVLGILFAAGVGSVHEALLWLAVIVVATGFVARIATARRRDRLPPNGEER